MGGYHGGPQCNRSLGFHPPGCVADPTKELYCSQIYPNWFYCEHGGVQGIAFPTPPEAVVTAGADGPGPDTGGT